MPVASQEASELFLKQRLKRLRMAAGLTQEVVAELAGISAIYYQSIEAGRRSNVSLRIITKLAAAYSLSLHEFFAPEMPKFKVRRIRN